MQPCAMDHRSPDRLSSIPAALYIGLARLVGGYKRVRGFRIEDWPVGTDLRDTAQARRKGKGLLYGVKIVPRIVANLVSDTRQGEQSTGHSRVTAGDEELGTLLRAVVSLHEGFVVPRRLGGRGRRDVLRAVGRGKVGAGVREQVLLEFLALSFKQGLDPHEAINHGQGAGIFYSRGANGF